MVSVDLRTRTAADERPVDAAAFFGGELPALLDDHRALAAPGARELELRPIAIEVDGAAWVLAFNGDAFAVAPTCSPQDAATHWRLDAEALVDIVNDTRTPVGLLAGGDLDTAKGGLQEVLDWTVVLRSVLDARPVYTAGAVDFRDRRGGPLDFGQSFRPDDEPAEMAHFLGEADVPWHKDCSLGSHSYRCCSLTVGVSVIGADANSGQLRVVPGSHRALIQAGFVRHNLDLPQIALPTETGDLTVHLSCTLHMAQPPVTQERRVLYTDFSMPSPDGQRAPGDAKLARIREGAPTTVSQPAAVR